MSAIQSLPASPASGTGRPSGTAGFAAGGSVSVKLAAVIAVIMIVATLVAEVLLIGARSDAGRKDFNENKLLATTLTADQISGALRWDRPEAIAPVLSGVAAMDGSDFANAVALNEKGVKVAALAEGRYAAHPGLEQFAAGSVQSLRAGKPVIRFDDGHMLVAVAVRAGKDREYVGALAMAFALDELNGELRSAAVQSTIFGVVFLALVIGLLVIAVRRVVSRPLVELSAAIDALAAGRSVAVPGADRADEIGRIARAVQVFAGADVERRVLADKQAATSREVSRLAAGVMANANRVADAAADTTRSLQQLALGASQQASALQQVASALNQSNRAITEISQNALATRKSATTISERTEEGRKRLGELTELTLRTQETSTQISEVTKVINEISRKTNLLSLNARIEAANAGESGRGFGVVANEVEVLSHNVAGSAEDIAQKVEQILGDARLSAEAARSVGATIDALRDDIRNNVEMMSSISAAVEQTEVTITELNASFKEIDQVIQGNSTAMERMSSAMGDLSRLADAMRSELSDLEKATV